MKDNKVLIHLVKQHRCLYDTKIREYRNKELKQTTWESIAAEMEDSVIRVKQKWKALRDGYAREKRAQACAKPGSPAQAIWPFYRQMEFLKDFMMQRSEENDQLAVPNRWIDDAKLVDMVKTHRCLYDKSSREYTVMSLKEQAWAEIAVQLNGNALEVKTRWKTLRDKFVRQKRHIDLQRRDLPPGGGKRIRSRWFLYERMKFVEDFTAAKKRKSHPDASDDDSDESYIALWPEKNDVDLFEQGSVVQSPQMDVSEDSNEAPECSSSAVAVKQENVEDTAFIDPDALPQEAPTRDILKTYVSIIEEKLRIFPEEEREQIAMEIITMLNAKIFRK